MTTVITEYYTPQEYDNELNKILTLDQPRFAAFFYHAISKVIYDVGEETVSETGFAVLCDYLLARKSELPKDLADTIKDDDLKKYTCTLVARAPGEPFKPGVHYFNGADLYLTELEDSLLTDFRLEIWENNASTD